MQGLYCILSPMSDYCIVLNTCPDRNSAQQIATQLVEQRLAACVNLLDNITSIYRWQGGIEQDRETLLVIKTEKALYHTVEASIRQQHPYEVPEVICLEIADGTQTYLDWITQSTHP